MTAATGASPQLTRVALREIHETAFRALVAAGANTGQADTAAAQVLDAELHHRAGLRGLLADLRLGRWPDDPVPVHQDGATCVVGGDTPSDLLRIGVHLVELATARAGAPPTVSPTPRPFDPLIDSLLLQAAERTGTPVAAARATGTQTAIRVGTPAGDLGLGSPEIIENAVPPIPPGALTVFVADTLSPRVGEWQSRDERAQRRRLAAREGLHVESALWEPAYEAASRFLVPEQ